MRSFTSKTQPSFGGFSAATVLIMSFVTVFPFIFTLGYVICRATSSYYSTFAPDSTCNGYESRMILAMLCAQVMLILPVITSYVPDESVTGRIALLMYVPAVSIVIPVAFLCEGTIRLMRHGHVDFSSMFAHFVHGPPASETPFQPPLCVQVVLLLMVGVYACSCELPDVSELLPIELAALMFVLCALVYIVSRSTFRLFSSSPVILEPRKAVSQPSMKTARSEEKFADAYRPTVTSGYY